MSLNNLLIIFLFASNVYAGSGPVKVPKLANAEFAVFDGTKYRKFSTFIAYGLKLSSECKPKKGPIICKAFEASTKKIEKIISPASQMNPASILCNQLGGKNLIALNNAREEFNYCEFEDRSMANSWSLYYKFYPKNIMK